MSLTPYAQACALYNSNIEVADRCALNREHECKAEYYAAKRDYMITKDRFCSRGPAAPLQDTESRYDISRYTSSCGPSMLEYYSDSKDRSLRDIDQELMRRAELRLQEDLAKGVVSSKSAMRHLRPGDDLKNLLRCQKDEYEDLLDIQAAYFGKILKLHKTSCYGELEHFHHMESVARKVMEDMEASTAIVLLADLRETIFQLERRLYERACGDYTTRPMRSCSEETATDDPLLLDSMYAVPLWQRVLVIREETISEEDIASRYLMLTENTQHDLTARGYIRLCPKNGLIERVPRASVPYLFNEALTFAFKGERACVQASEEIARMNIVDEAVDMYDLMREELRRISGLTQAALVTVK